MPIDPIQGSGDIGSASNVDPCLVKMIKKALETPPSIELASKEKILTDLKVLSTEKMAHQAEHIPENSSGLMASILSAIAAVLKNAAKKTAEERHLGVMGSHTVARGKDFWLSVIFNREVL